jgi:tRNA-dihydrouridine synthase
MMKPLLALAPLHEVTDAAFRETVAACGAPDRMYTEFTSVDGLAHPISRERIIRRYLQRFEGEDKTYAQLWGTDPQKWYDAAVLVRELGFAGVDINMGCPDKTVLKLGGGGALIGNHSLAGEIIAATREGAGAVPVSVKTRLGRESDSADTWIPFLLEGGIKTLTIHGRTVRELSKVPARWNRIGMFQKEAAAHGVTLIGNGDITSRADALAHIATYGVDGAMVGRGIFGNPWFFNEERETGEVPLQERLQALADLAERFEKRYGDFRSLSVIRKHVKGLVHGFAGAGVLRERLMTCTSATAFREVATQYPHANS